MNQIPLNIWWQIIGLLILELVVVIGLVMIALQKLGWLQMGKKCVTKETGKESYYNPRYRNHPTNEIKTVKTSQNTMHDQLIVLEEGQKTLFKRLDKFEGKLDSAVSGVAHLQGLLEKRFRDDL